MPRVLDNREAVRRALKGEARYASGKTIGELPVKDDESPDSDDIQNRLLLAMVEALNEIANNQKPDDRIDRLADLVEQLIEERRKPVPKRKWRFTVQPGPDGRIREITAEET